MKEEIFPLVDESGKIIGQATRCECHSGTMWLHPVIHLHVFNSRGELFLQKRSATKDIQPNKWDSSVGGHVDLNETPLQATIREAREEIGITDFTPHYIEKHIIQTDRECELTFCFFTLYNKIITIDKEEVSDGRFWTLKEITENIGKDIFTPNFELDFEKFLSKGMPQINA